jgi:hypothetical protein
MIAGGTQTTQAADLNVRAGARLAVAAQLAIIGFYVAGALVPALRAGLLPADSTSASHMDSVQLWPATASAPIQLLHVLAFFAASVGIVVSLACVPVCLGILASRWRSYGRPTRTLLGASAALGVAFVIWSATPTGTALRDWIAA